MLPLKTYKKMSKKLWIYQSDRILTESELDEVSNAASQFVAGWQSHGKKLNAGFEIQRNAFLFLWVDESVQEATGCSIDSSVAFLRQLQDKGIDLLNRSMIAYDVNGELQFAERRAFLEAVKLAKIPPHATVFNNSIDRDNRMKEWEKLISESWAAKWLPQSTSP